MSTKPKNKAAVALGKLSSPKKAQAARINGKKGGRKPNPEMYDGPWSGNFMWWHGSERPEMVYCDSFVQNESGGQRYVRCCYAWLDPIYVFLEEVSLQPKQ